MGVRAIGSLGTSGTILSRQTLEAIGTLLAIGMEHARAVEQLGQTEAARQGEQLRTALARRGDARAAHPAHVDQGVGDESAFESQPAKSPRGRSC